ncbi:NADH-quinone oxidoreductase subunit NuoE family protein [Arcticibacterium luteifluviistationis]|uniref:NAD(P)H-dependent oxidoreductase subunit E n=1 Tax=Arcticibacterium luteifluviistationis TaxID=1784714 RepID=A0A2Z4GI06_9BACT|nr:NAD(P)H-dependent oxidoreductase subunit E [Arcticibacterium luteifluviistationis]AWW00599.1 NAD(P)H-dependent oxidoreductase subunit E [Arcticibacterium luteifluviistationis]
MPELTENIVFSKERLEKVEEIIARYPEGKQKSALLPILHLAQEQFSWLSSQTMDYVAGLLSIQPVEVYEVATFYTMFHLQPVGKHVIEYCRTGPCCVMGGEEVYAHLREKLNIETGQTTEDGLITLKEVECLAACGWGPCFQIREKYFMHLDNQKVDEIIEDLRKTN